MSTKKHFDHEASKEAGARSTLTPYQEHHFQNPEDVGVAWDTNRVWVCLNGVALLRAKVIGDRLFVEFYRPQDEEEVAMEARS